jgi:hypothetical protein
VRNDEWLDVWMYLISSIETKQTSVSVVTTIVYPTVYLKGSLLRVRQSPKSMICFTTVSFSRMTSCKIEYCIFTIESHI